MANTFTTVTNRGCLSNIFGSFLGFIIGPILVVGAIWLLGWNEGRAVQAISGLGDAAGQVVEASSTAVDPGKEGKLVHVSGAVTATNPINDPDVSVQFHDQVAVARTVQMYEWQKTEQKTRDKLGGGTETVTTYTYSQDWSDQAINSSRFEHPENHANPPMPFQAARWTAGDARLGAYTMDDQVLKLVTLDTPLRPDTPQGWTLSNGALTRGDPAAPKVGDLRVTYVGLPSGTVLSVLAAQNHTGFGTFTTRNGYQLEMVDKGNQPAASMVSEKKQSEGALTWALRVFGFSGIFIGVAMFLGPLSAIASVIPILGSITRGAAFLAALVISVPTTLTVVAIAWITFRPILGVGLLVAAAALLFGLHRWHRMQHPVGAASAPAPTPPPRRRRRPDVLEFGPVVASADNAPWLLRPPAERRLTVGEARARLQRLPPPGRIDGFPNVRDPQPAALLIPLGDADGEAALAVTKRPGAMLRHRDNWVFPGGRFDPGVDADSRAAAVREAGEELGFPTDQVTILGQLNTRGPISTGFVIDVFVGLVDFAYLAPDPHEVAECAVSPISILAGGYQESFELPEFDTGPLADGVVLSLDRRREKPIRFFEIRAGEHLWGLQGEILHELLSALLPAP